MSENDSIFGSLIYRAIGEPEYWVKNSIEPLLKLFTDGYGLDGPDRLAQVQIGKNLLGKLSEKDTLVSAITSIFDEAKYGFLIIDHSFKAIYHNRKAEPHLSYLIEPEKNNAIRKELSELICEQSKSRTINSEMIRLDYQCGEFTNIYLRSLLKENTGLATPQYLYQIMVFDSNDNNNQICQEVSKAYGLSEREISIVQSAVKALASGGSTKEIADDLFISPNTVKTHLKSIYAKSGVKSLASLVSLYFQHEVQQLTSYFGSSGSIHEDRIKSNDKTVSLSDGQIICYKEYGDSQGKPLIVLHNMYSSRLNVPPNGDELAIKSGRRIIIPDRPGYGKTPISDIYPEKWSKTLVKFSEELDLQEFDLLGNALSVRYALEFADQFPDKLSKLILTAPLLHVSIDDKKHFSKWVSVSTELFERSPEFAAELYKLWHSSAALRLDSHIRENLSMSISSAERDKLENDDFIKVLKDNFRESAAHRGMGSAADFSYCLNKCTLDLSQITTHAEIWLGSEDGLCSAEGVRVNLDVLPNKTYFEKEGYGEHIYYSLFEQIISLRSK